MGDPPVNGAPLSVTLVSAMSLNSIGLLFDFIGVLILAFTDLPRGDLLADGTRILQDQGDEVSRKQAKIMVVFSKSGLGLIILGFFLQFIGSVDFFKPWVDKLTIMLSG